MEAELRRNQEIVQQLAAEMEIIAEIGRLISSTLDIDEVYERFAAEARKLIPFDRLVVNLNKPQENIALLRLCFRDGRPRAETGRFFSSGILGE